MIGKITFLLSLAHFASASKEKLPLNIFRGPIPKSRSLSSYIGCSYQEAYQREFCCPKNKTSEAECLKEFNQWKEILIAASDLKERKEQSKDMKDSTADVTKWVSIGVLGICCPILIIIGVVVWYVKRRQAKQIAELDKATNNGIVFTPEDNQQNQNVTIKAKVIQAKALAAAERSQRAVQDDKLRDFSESESAAQKSESSASYYSESQVSYRESQNEPQDPEKRKIGRNSLIFQTHVAKAEDFKNLGGNNKSETLSNESKGTKASRSNYGSIETPGLQSSFKALENDVSQYLQTNMSIMSQDPMLKNSNSALYMTDKQYKIGLTSPIVSKAKLPNSLAQTQTNLNASASIAYNADYMDEEGDSKRDKEEDLNELHGYLQPKISDEGQRKKHLEVAQTVTTNQSSNILVSQTGKTYLSNRGGNKKNLDELSSSGSDIGIL